MKILPYNKLYTTGARQNFNSVCSVSCAYVDDEYFGYRQSKVLNIAAKALASGMHKGTLPEDVMQKVYKYFPDFDLKENNSTATPCYHTHSNGRHFDRQNQVNILAGYDAELYKRDALTPEDKEKSEKEIAVLRAIQLDTFERILDNSGKINELCIFTKRTGRKIGGKDELIVTDIDLASNVPPVRGTEHTYKA